ncbi:MAG: hypothetical protein ACTSRK_02000 [Promethearchaeota archaeon]
MNRKASINQILAENAACNKIPLLIIQVFSCNRVDVTKVHDDRYFMLFLP